MITAEPFGVLSDGTPVTRYRLPGGEDAWVDILDYGAAIQSLVLPDQDGNPVDVVLGFDTPEGYETTGGCLGAIVGRHANRIGGGRFTLNGRTWELEKNNGPNHLHGGSSGYHRRMFSAEIREDTLVLTLHSPDGDQGYPGNLELRALYRFEDYVLSLELQAVSDQDTVVNLTNHSYFDLSGGTDPMGQRLFLASEQFCENDENTLPTGALLYVLHTPFDFRQEKTVGQDLDREHPQLLRCGGYDHNFVLDNGGRLSLCGTLRSPETGIMLALYTDLPGVQLYSANGLHGAGKGREFGPRDAVCLEPQFFPNAMAVEGWKKPILRAGETWQHRIVYQFGIA